MDISNLVCFAWLHYTGQATHSTASITHNFPITFTTVYSIVSNAYDDVYNINSGYYNPKEWTNSSVTYMYKLNKFAFITGKLT